MNRGYDLAYSGHGHRGCDCPCHRHHGGGHGARRKPRAASPVRKGPPKPAAAPRPAPAVLPPVPAPEPEPEPMEEEEEHAPPPRREEPFRNIVFAPPRSIAPPANLFPTWAKQAPKMIYVPDPSAADREAELRAMRQQIETSHEEREAEADALKKRVAELEDALRDALKRAGEVEQRARAAEGRVNHEPTQLFAELAEAKAKLRTSLPPAALPKAPAITKVAPAGPGAATIAWSVPVADAAAEPVKTIDIWWDGRKQASVGPQESSYTARGLKPGAPYAFSLRGVSDAGKGPLCAPVSYVEVVAPAKQPRVNAPRDVAASEAGPGAATVSWREPEPLEGPVARFDVYSEGAAAPLGSVPASAGTGKAGARAYEFKATGLKAGAHAFSVAAVGEAPADAAAAVPVAHSAPAEAPGSGAVGLTWKARGRRGEGGGYVVYADGEKIGEAPAGKSAEEPIKYRATGLQAPRAYAFTVAARTKAGEGERSAPASALVAAVAPRVNAPRDVAASEAGPGAATVSWREPEPLEGPWRASTSTRRARRRRWERAGVGGDGQGRRAAYEFKATGLKAGAHAFSVAAVGEAPADAAAAVPVAHSAPSAEEPIKYRATGLQAPRAYAFTVAARTKAGEGERSAPASALVAAVAPRVNAPRDVAASEAGPGAATVSWREPEPLEGPVARFDVYSEGAAAPLGSVPASAGTGKAGARAYEFKATGLKAGAHAFSVAAVGEAPADAAAAVPVAHSAPVLATISTGLAGAPTGLEAKAEAPGSGAVGLTWKAPRADAAKVEGYVVYADGEKIGEAPAGKSAEEPIKYRATGLQAPRAYAFTVAARTKAGEGERSAPASALVAAVAPRVNAPRDVAASEAGPGRRRARRRRWERAGVGGDGQGRRAAYEFKATGLKAGAHAFSVAAVGEAPADAAAAVPVAHSAPVLATISTGLAGAPTGLEAKAEAPGSGAVGLTWKAPRADAAKVEGYVVYADGEKIGEAPAGKSAEEPIKYRATGLQAPRAYAFTVAARTKAGEGERSAPASALVAAVAPRRAGVGGTGKAGARAYEFKATGLKAGAHAFSVAAVGEAPADAAAAVPVAHSAPVLATISTGLAGAPTAWRPRRRHRAAAPSGLRGRPRGRTRRRWRVRRLRGREKIGEAPAGKSAEEPIKYRATGLQAPRAYAFTVAARTKAARASGRGGERGRARAATVSWREPEPLEGPVARFDVYSEGAAAPLGACRRRRDGQGRRAAYEFKATGLKAGAHAFSVAAVGEAPADARRRGAVGLTWKAPRADAAKVEGAEEPIKYRATGLQAPRAYAFTVAARTKAGEGERSAPASALVAAVAPRVNAPRTWRRARPGPGGDGELAGAGAAGGPVARFDVYSEGAAAPLGACRRRRDGQGRRAAYEFKATGLNAGAHAFSVAAVGEAPADAAAAVPVAHSAPVLATISTGLAGAPTGLQAKAEAPGSGAVGLTWKAPRADAAKVEGAEEPIKYRATGLQAPRAYAFTVAARTKAGEGERSAPASALVAAVAPRVNAPRDVAASEAGPGAATGAAAPLGACRRRRDGQGRRAAYEFKATGLKAGAHAFSVAAVGEAPADAAARWRVRRLRGREKIGEAPAGKSTEEPIKYRATGLQAPRAYAFTVAARTKAGEGERDVAASEAGPGRRRARRRRWERAGVGGTGKAGARAYEFKATGLKAGAHAFSVAAVGEAPADAAAVVPVAHSAPAEAPGSGAVGLTWKAPRADAAKVEGYVVYADGEKIGEAPAGKSAEEPIKYRATGLQAPRAYAFTVAARTKAGEGERSAPVAVLIAAQAATVGAPKDVSTVEAGPGVVLVMWREPDPAEGTVTLYEVYSESSSNPFGTIGTVLPSAVSGKPGTRRYEYKATGLKPGPHCFVITAVGEQPVAGTDGRGARTAAGAAPAPTAHSKPIMTHVSTGLAGAPTGLEAKAEAPGSGAVGLTWKAPRADAAKVEGYVVYADGEKIGEAPAGKSAEEPIKYRATGLQAPRAYAFTVAARTKAGEGERSAPASALVAAVAPRVNAPRDVAASEAGPGRRRVPASAGTGKAGARAYEFKATGLKAGAHAFSVAAVGEAPADAAARCRWRTARRCWRRSRRAWRGADGLEAKAEAPGSGAVGLTWKPRGRRGEGGGYVVYADGEKIGEAPAGKSAEEPIKYRATGLQAPRAYAFTVAARTKAGEGERSAPASALVAAVAPRVNAPGTSRRARPGPGRRRVPASAGTGKAGARAYEFKATGLKAGAHAFSVAAVGEAPADAAAAVPVAHSAPVLATISTGLAGAPTGLEAKAEAPGSSAVGLTWKAPRADAAKVEGYVVYADGEKIGEAPAGKSTEEPIKYRATGLQAPRAYAFTVAARTKAGEGERDVAASEAGPGAATGAAAPLGACRRRRDGQGRRAAYEFKATGLKAGAHAFSVAAVGEAPADAAAAAWRGADGLEAKAEAPGSSAVGLTWKPRGRTRRRWRVRRLRGREKIGEAPAGKSTEEPIKYRATGLQAPRAYAFTVAARTKAGEGERSAPASALVAAWRRGWREPEPLEGPWRASTSTRRARRRRWERAGVGGTGKAGARAYEFKATGLKAARTRSRCGGGRGAGGRAAAVPVAHSAPVLATISTGLAGRRRPGAKAEAPGSGAVGLTWKAPRADTAKVEGYVVYADGRRSARRRRARARRADQVPGDGPAGAAGVRVHGAARTKAGEGERSAPASALVAAVAPRPEPLEGPWRASTSTRRARRRRWERAGVGGDGQGRRAAYEFKATGLKAGAHAFSVAAVGEAPADAAAAVPVAHSAPRRRRAYVEGPAGGRGEGGGYVVYADGEKIGEAPAGKSAEEPIKYRATGLQAPRAYAFTVAARTKAGEGERSAPASALVAAVAPRPEPLEGPWRASTSTRRARRRRWGACRRRRGRARRRAGVRVQGDGPEGGRARVLGGGGGRGAGGRVAVVPVAHSAPVLATISTGLAGAPTGLEAKAEAPGSGAVGLTWKAPRADAAKVEGYVVYADGEKIGEAPAGKSAEEPIKYRATGLQAPRAYAFTVAARTKAGEGERSAPASALVAAVAPRVNAPRDVAASEAGPGAATVNWREPEPLEGPVARFDVYSEGAAAPLGSVPASAGTGKAGARAYEFKATGLAFGPHAFSVASVGVPAAGSPEGAAPVAHSAPVALALVKPRPPPFELRVASTWETGVELAWTRPRHVPQGSIVGFDVMQDGRAVGTAPPTPDVAYKVDGLAPGSSYRFAVRTQLAGGAEAGEDLCSSPVVVTVLVPKPPAPPPPSPPPAPAPLPATASAMELNLIDVRPRTANVKWKRPQGLPASIVVDAYETECLMRL
eukprot:tig00000361_g24389.t1